MKIIVEDKVPYIRGILESAAHVEYLPAAAIDADALRDADALITRTRPKLGEHNLRGSHIRSIATATIGTDHIDLDYCQRNGIEVHNAPGCNAPAVAQWVMAAIKAFGLTPENRACTLGVIGHGNVGSIVATWGRQLGFRVLVNDPPLQANSPTLSTQTTYSSLDEIKAQADIITFHTPLTTEGNWPTYHLADHAFFHSLGKRPLILNASRGEVVDTRALIEAIDNHLVAGAAIDTWEREPEISSGLLQKARIATPHIAGYSLQGKQRASMMALQALADHLGIDITLPFELPDKRIEGLTTAEILDSYDILADTRALKTNLTGFEHLRNDYALRPEPGFQAVTDLGK